MLWQMFSVQYVFSIQYSVFTGDANSVDWRCIYIWSTRPFVFPFLFKTIVITVENHLHLDMRVVSSYVSQKSSDSQVILSSSDGRVFLLK